MKQRDHTIDIAKGLLIFFVVWFHMKTILGGSCGLEHPMFNVLHMAYKGYSIFFMPAFFFITGYCSNFDKTFKDFLMSNIKGILIPMVVLNVIPCLLSFSIEGLWYLVTWGNWLYGLSFWFLPVLFVAKMMFWSIARLIQGKWLMLSVLLVCFAGAILFVQFDLLPNYWYWKSALAYVFFLGIGYLFKHEVSVEKQVDWMQIGTCIYVVILGFVLWLDLPVWYLGLVLSCTFTQMPLFLVAATTGTLAVLYIARLISNSIVLEYLGRASLVIYCGHWFIGQHLGKYIARFFFPDSNVKAFVFCVLIVALTLCCCCIYNYIFQRLITNRWLK